MLRTLVARAFPAVLVLGVLLACKLPEFGKDDADAGGAAAPAPTPTPAAPAPKVAESAAPAASLNIASAVGGSEYALAGVTTAPDNCREAFAVLGTVPLKVHDQRDFFWRFARQVFLANPKFKYGIPEAQSEVVFQEGPHKPTGGFALAARCVPGKVCNQIAAAYKTVVPTSKPEVVCGKAPPSVTLESGAAVLEFAPSPPDGFLRVSHDANLPAKDDVVSQCVRLAACKAERDKKLDGDPAIECQKKPTGFKVACALKKSCKEVLACSGD